MTLEHLKDCVEIAINAVEFIEIALSKIPSDDKLKKVLTNQIIEFINIHYSELFFNQKENNISQIVKNYKYFKQQIEEGNL